MEFFIYFKGSNKIATDFFHTLQWQSFLHFPIYYMNGGQRFEKMTKKYFYFINLCPLKLTLSAQTFRQICLDSFISKLIFSIWLINLVYHKPTLEGRMISNYVTSNIKLFLMLAFIYLNIFQKKFKLRLLGSFKLM